MDEINSFLYDILNSIIEIESYFNEETFNFEFYKSDLKTKRAVERDFEIIGEAVNRVLKIKPDFSLTNSQNIIGLRNRIIHAYDNISDEIIWSTIISDLPLLKQEVSKYLNED